METQTTPRIEKIESLGDLELLMKGDIVEVEGRKYLMRIHYNGKRDKILNLVGRYEGEIIQLTVSGYSEIKFKSGKLILTEDISTRFIDNFRTDNTHRNFYNFYKKMLMEAGIWERE